MFSFIGGIASAVAAVLKFVNDWRQSRRDRQNQEVGALKQREADQKATLKAKDDQLRKAADARPGDFAKRVRDGNL